MEDRSGTTPTALPFTVDLGQRLLVVQEERVVLIVDHAQGAGAVRLDGDETYTVGRVFNK